YGTMRVASLPVEVPLDLRRTLRPLHGSFATDGWWMAARTPEGPGSLRLHRTSDELVGTAWGDGAAWLLERMGGIAGLGDDPGCFVTEHPLVAELHRRHPGYRFGRTGLVFDALVAAVCAQKVTGVEAARAMRGLKWEFSERAPGPNHRLHLPPDPDRMAAAPYWKYHRLHLERRRAEVLRRLAACHHRISGLGSEEPDKGAAALGAYPGIGPWTVAEALAISHGDPDQVSVGDFHLKHIVVHHLTGRARGSDEEMMELLEPFRPHRGRVVRLLSTLGREPAFGPRSPARDITRM
ncbi:MAG: DNA-3-methyladenine glycosylase 2 family protein, partial [Actinobacteria bacterium]|nr:DNA-3-methyladenine glycosylase 2 family protein [Actinomycetota bacterium]